MSEGQSYIIADEHGVRRVGKTRISLDSVVIGFQQGDSPEEIQRNFPALSLEQVYGAIAHYLGHRAEVDSYLRWQRETWDEARERSEREPNAALGRLRQARTAGTGQKR